MDLARFQQEVGAWGKKNFGDQPTWIPLHGIIEELGELLDSDGDDEYEDALGDCMVYLAHFCALSGRDLEALWDMRVHHEPGMPLLVAVGHVFHHHLKLTQGIRGTPAEHNAGINEGLVQVIVELINIVGEEQLLEAIEKTWARVSQRDWKADPEHGGEL